LRSFILFKYHCMLPDYTVSKTRCRTHWIAHTGMILAVLATKQSIWWYSATCKYCVRGWHLSFIITIPAAWHPVPVETINTNTRRHLTPDLTFNTLQTCGNICSIQDHVGIQTSPHPGKHCIIFWWLRISPSCRPSTMSHMNYLLVRLKRHHRNC
jgi:hypothetical protein